MFIDHFLSRVRYVQRWFSALKGLYLENTANLFQAKLLQFQMTIHTDKGTENLNTNRSEETSVFWICYKPGV